MKYQTRCDACGALTPWTTKKAAVAVAESHAAAQPDHYRMTRVTSR